MLAGALAGALAGGPPATALGAAAAAAEAADGAADMAAERADENEGEFLLAKPAEPLAGYDSDADFISQYVIRWRYASSLGCTGIHRLRNQSPQARAHYDVPANMASFLPS